MWCRTAFLSSSLVNNELQNLSYKIESLKLLHIFTYPSWDDKKCKVHTEKMIKVLHNSFKEENNTEDSN